MDNSFKPELVEEVKGLPCYIYSYQKEQGDGSTDTVYLFSKEDYDLVLADYDIWAPECHGCLGKHLTVTGSPEYKKAIANSVAIRTYTKIMKKAPRRTHLFFLHIGLIEDSEDRLSIEEKSGDEDALCIFNEAFDEDDLRYLEPRIKNSEAIKASEIQISFGYVNTNLENYFKNLYCYCAVDRYGERKCAFFKVFED